MLRAVLFDLDDTITERAATLAAYVPHFIRDFGDRLQVSDPAALTAELARVDRNGYNPLRAAELAELAFWSVSPGEQALAVHWRQHFVACTQGRPGLQATIDQLLQSGLRIGVVTNGPSHAQRRKLALLGLRERITALAISEELGISKPDPAIFRAATTQLGVEPEQCAFIGDNPEKDVVASAALGMRAIWLRGATAWPAGLAPAQESIMTLAELLPLLGLAREA